MEVRFFVDACETLARFASVRENAKEPADRILIQSYGGSLKLIAGTDTKTVIVDCGPSEDIFRALVSARVFLSAGKALKGKGQVTIEKAPDGVILRVTTGGEVRLPNVASMPPAYERPVLIGARGEAAAGLLPSAVKRVTAVADKSGWLEQVVFSVGEGLDVSVRAMDSHMYVEHPDFGLDGAEELPVPVDFVESLRGFEGACDIILSNRLTVVCGPYTAVTQPLSKTPLPRWPATTENSSVLADRKQLIAMVKGTAPHDEHNRVALTASGSSISCSPWGKDDTGISLPAKVDGTGGRIGVTADYLLKLLNAIPTTKVGLAWEAGATGVIRVFGENDPWRQLLAPVAL